jgi:hypothetical protein
MSTALGCHFLHVKEGWFYRLEQYAHREEYDIYGPFVSFEAAYDHLRCYQANPGGFSADDPEGPPHEARSWERAEIAAAIDPSVGWR